MPNDSLITIRVDADQFQIDLQDLTWGEAEELETIIGGSLAENMESVKGVIALAFMAKKRKHPLTTIDELRALPMSAIEIVEGESDALPTQGVADEGSGIQ